MKKVKLLYEGKAKKVYTTQDCEKLIVSYKDDATAFNGVKKGTIKEKGSINNRVSNHLMKVLEDGGVSTHLIKEISSRETIVRKVEIIPLEVIIRNIVAGSLCKRLGLNEGTKLRKVVLEYSYKDDSLGDPMINDYHVFALDLATKEELEIIVNIAFKVNDILSKYLESVNIELIDFKIEFGRTSDGRIILADEISPDTCRFWDSNTGEILDKDRFRRELGNIEGAYQEILKRLLGTNV